MNCSMRFPPDEEPICFDCELMKTPKVVLEKMLSMLTNKYPAEDIEPKKELTSSELDDNIKRFFDDYMQDRFNYHGFANREDFCSAIRKYIY